MSTQIMDLKDIATRFPDAVVSGDGILVKTASLLEVATWLKDTPGLEMEYLVFMTGVDYLDYFELVYFLRSLKTNSTIYLKTRVSDREDPVAPSVVGLWKGADYQEREVYDMFGIKFEGHPNMKRLFLWEGFNGFPLRKDYL